MTKGRLKAFPPVAGESPRVLILGSMPGGESLRRGQYYAHPANAFWPLMGEILGFDPSAPYPERLERLKEAKIALWDVLESCVRPGSLDSAIREAKPNGFRKFFKVNSSISRIILNGGTAERLFLKNAAEYAPPGCLLLKAPSTSPAYASLNFEGKLKAWRKLLAAKP